MNAISPPRPAAAKASADADTLAMEMERARETERSGALPEGSAFSPSGDISIEPGQPATGADKPSAASDAPWPDATAERMRARAASAAGAIPPRLTNIEVTLTVELGRRQVPIRDLLASAPGQLFALEALTDDPVDVMVNGRLFARGEIVNQGDRYAVRLLSLAEQEG